MSRFDGESGLVVVRVRIVGPAQNHVARLALDTGATDTTISPKVLGYAGYDLRKAIDHVSIMMGDSVASAPIIELLRFSALGQERTAFPVIAHSFPPGATVDGVLGLDFMRDQKLTVDFRAGELSLQ